MHAFTTYRVASWRRLLALLPVIAGLLFASQARSSVEIDLYRIEQAAQTQSAAERQKLVRRSLAALYVRLTGEEDALRRYPSLRTSLDQASRFVSSFNYVDVDVPHERAGSRGTQRMTYLQLVFDGRAVNRLLAEAGAPLWGAVRPQVLVWLVEQDAGERLIVSPENRPLRSDQLERMARRRGVPLLQPLLDLEERTRIDAQALWERDWVAISQASRRYRPAAILVGKLGRGSTANSLDSGGASGRWLGQWQLLYQGETLSSSYQGEDLDAFFSRGLALAASRFASQYAVAGQGAANQVRRLIRVSGVQSQRDYVALSALLGQAQGLSAVQLQRVEGDQCWFSFESTADRRQLNALLTLDARLRRGAFAGAELHYDWQSTE